MLVVYSPWFIIYYITGEGIGIENGYYRSIAVRRLGVLNQSSSGSSQSYYLSTDIHIYIYIYIYICIYIYMTIPIYTHLYI